MHVETKRLRNPEAEVVFKKLGHFDGTEGVLLINIGIFF